MSPEANEIEKPSLRQTWPIRRIVYALLLVAVAAAALYLGFHTYRLARQSEKLGEQSILETTLTLAKTRVRFIEDYIIETDHRALDDVLNLPDVQLDTDSEGLKTTLTRWEENAETLTPSVRALLVVNGSGDLIAEKVRAANRESRAFTKLFLREPFTEIKKAMLSADKPRSELQHLHVTLAGQSYLFSYIIAQTPRGVIAAVAHQDVGYLRRTVLPTVLCQSAFVVHDARLINPNLCTDQEALKLFSVVDEHNRVLVGPSLHRVRDYVVGIGFPTTLYSWRLQAAPNQAGKLQAVGRSQRTTSLVSWVLAWCVVLMGMALLVTAAIQERKVVTLKNEFIANVSHELKTPLSVIRMFSEMIASDRITDTAKTHQYANMILSETERLSRLIDNVLDFAQLEQGQPRYEMAERDLRDIVAKSIEAVQYRAERDGIALRTVGLESPALATYDEQALLLAMVNLLDNAIKYGGRTPVEIRLVGREDEIDIVVRDFGVGIAPHDVRKIFHRFYRPAGSRHVRGSGIGLSLVKSIAEAHGGRAWARNANPTGAEVGITLPRPASTTAKRIDPKPVYE